MIHRRVRFRIRLYFLFKSHWKITPLLYFELEKKIGPFLKKQSNGKISLWRTVTWPFREKEITSLQNIHMSKKNKMDIAISIVES